jgi:hypothetical protein
VPATGCSQNLKRVEITYVSPQIGIGDEIALPKGGTSRMSIVPLQPELFDEPALAGLSQQRIS